MRFGKQVLWATLGVSLLLVALAPTVEAGRGRRVRKARPRVAYLHPDRPRLQPQSVLPSTSPVRPQAVEAQGFTAMGIGEVQLGRTMCYVTDFGAIPDDGIDDSEAINRCIQRVQRKTSSDPTGRGEVIFLPGEYTIEDTILVGSDSATTRSIFLKGGPSYAESANASTVILDGSTLLDKPVVNLQGLRWGGMDGFLILGPNAQPAANTYPGGYTDDVDDWTTPGVSTGRYSPQCGIAVDAWNGTTPPDSGGYPGVTYSGSLGSPVSTESFGLTFRNITVRNHHVGFMIGPANVDIRGDLLRFEQVNAQFCAYAMSVGMRNSLGCVVQGFNLDRCHTAFTNNTHGKRAGDLYAFHDGFFNGVQRWFKINGNTSPKTWSNVFAEYCFRLGEIGVEMGSSPASPTSFTVSSWRHYKPLTLKGCRVRTWTSNPGTEANDPPIKLVTYAPVILEGCELEGFHSITNVAGPGPVTAKNCTFGFAPGVLGDGNMQHVFGYQPDNGEHVNIDDSLSATWVDPEPSELTLGFSRDTTAKTLPNRIWLQPWSKWIHEKSTGKSFVVKGAAVTSVAFPAGTYVHGADSGGNILTFTAGTAANFFVGDLLYWRHTEIDGAAEDDQPMFVGLRVISKSGATTVCRKLYDPQFYDETYAPSSILVVPVLWAPNPSIGLNADLTSGGPDLNNPPAGYAEALQVGSFVRGDDIPANTRILTVPGYLSEHAKRAYLGNPDIVGSAGPIITDIGCSDGYDGYGGGLVPTLSGTWRIKEETWQPTGTTPGGLGWKVLWDVGTDDLVAEIEVKAVNGGSSGLLFRYDDDDNFCQLVVGESSVSIYQEKAGVEVTTGSGGTGMTPQAGDVVRITASGANGTAILLRDGVQVGNAFTTNTLDGDLDGTKIGLRSNGFVQYGYIKCQPSGVAPAPTMNKNAEATTSNVPLGFAELHEVTQ